MGGPRGFTELRALLPGLAAQALSERLRALRERAWWRWSGAEAFPYGRGTS
ncbi:hypothetical protein [Streptomyces sp. AC627_RSS907]|uniref:hypothetical protein n=1 Tax=Streptomyces sp. AC627_RSS907 TaxID=2823684 RepID=UPI001C242908|nr:hypothetical protein [Streptomyces sp. AC627_RSS907]